MFPINWAEGTKSVESDEVSLLENTAHFLVALSVIGHAILQ